MRYFYYALIGIAVLVVLILLVCLIIHLRRKWACKKVKKLSPKEKIRDLDDALATFGFQYEPKGDFITTGMYPWQREMGYCRQYDEAAVLMNMVFDCEPVYFDYNGKRWLLEMWKGQYGCAAGAEIGLYVNEQGKKEEPEQLFYECVEDEERIGMQFVLYYNGTAIMGRRGVHWWLTGFCPGLYVKPQELALEVRLCFPTYGMRQAFCRGLIRNGYSREQLRVENTCVTFIFDSPRVEQFRRGSRLRKWYVSWKNKRYCRLYLRMSKWFASTLDRITFLGYCFPILYRKLIRLGTKVSKRRLHRYGRKKWGHKNRRQS